jgi:hypothetical protein
MNEYINNNSKTIKEYDNELDSSFIELSVLSPSNKNDKAIANLINNNKKKTQTQTPESPKKGKTHKRH